MLCIFWLLKYIFPYQLLLVFGTNSSLPLKVAVSSDLTTTIVGLHFEQKHFEILIVIATRF